VWNDFRNDEKDYCIDDLMGVAILTPTLPSVADAAATALFTKAGY